MKVSTFTIDRRENAVPMAELAQRKKNDFGGMGVGGGEHHIADCKLQTDPVESSVQRVLVIEAAVSSITVKEPGLETISYLANALTTENV